MQNNSIQAPFNSSIPDSSGIYYLQKFTSIPLKTDFIKVGYINHAEQKQYKTSTAVEKQNTEKSKSFAFRLEYSDFILILILALFSLLAYIRLTGRNYFKRLIMSVRNYTYSVSFYREKNLAFVLYKNLLLLVFYVSAALLGSSVMSFFNFPPLNPDRTIQLLILTLVIFLLFTLNRLLIRLSAFFFGKSRLASEYLFYYGNLLRVVGILFLLLNVGLFFINKEARFIFIYLSLFIGFTVYFIKVLRILIIFFNNRFSLYYLILYFCALEIIPVVLLIKLFLFYELDRV